jgi:hypothetical protein
MGLFRKTILLLLLFSGVGTGLFAQNKKKPPVKYWEELHDTAKANLKNSTSLNPFALSVLNGTFLVSGDDASRKLLLDVTTQSEQGLPLHFYVFNTILKKHDPSAKEMMGEFCRRMIYAHPDYVFKYLQKDALNKGSLGNLYAQFVREQSSPIELQNLRNFLEYYFSSGSKSLKPTVDDWLKKVSGKKK